MKKTITIGIIVYNVEKFLPACLESAIRQKGDDIEIIVVDDGSTDASGKICDEYAARDSRIKVVHKENGGASTARNVIIDIAEGEWISFVDGDDMLTDNAVETMKQSLSNEYQIIFFDVIHFKDDNAIPAYNIDLPDMELTGDILRTFSLQTVYPGNNAYDFVNRTTVSPWGKVYNRAFLLEHELKYEPAARKGQDMMFSIYCLPYLKKALLVRKATYLYRISDTSVSNRYNENIAKYINSFITVLGERMLSRPEEFDGEFVRRFYARCIVCIKSTCELYFFNKNSPKSFKEREKEFLEYIEKPGCVEAINNCDPSILTKRNKTLYDMFKSKDAKALNRYFKLRDTYNGIKNLADRIKK